MKEQTMIRISKLASEQLDAIADNEGVTKGAWIEWAVSMAHQCLPQMKKKKLEDMPNPFRTWGRKIAPKGELPPGYSEEELN